MEEMLKYENRHKLYQFLLDDYEFKVKEEKYDPNAFGNFYVDLVSKYFLLRYYNDKNFVSIEIASHQDVGKWYALSFIRDLIYNPDSINAKEITKDNSNRINELNAFLSKDFVKICELLGEAQYSDTKKKLDEGLRKTFFLKYPSARL